MITKCIRLLVLSSQRKENHSAVEVTPRFDATLVFSNQQGSTWSSEEEFSVLDIIALQSLKAVFHSVNHFMCSPIVKLSRRTKKYLPIFPACSQLKEELTQRGQPGSCGSWSKLSFEASILKRIDLLALCFTCELCQADNFWRQ